MFTPTATKRWTSLLLIAALLIALIPPMKATAAAARIEITNLYKAASIVNGKPHSDEDNKIIRYTTNPITVAASIDGINTNQIQNIYFEVTNMNTGVTITDKTNKAQVAGTYDIVFNGVSLTEGLNRVVLKISDNVTIASEAGWVYFTPTTNIQNFKVNNDPWDENKIYPLTPGTSTSVAITGDAPNATDIQVQKLGDSSPRSLFMPGSSFFMLTGDDMNKPTPADFKFAPGDNLLTFIAQNASKTFQVDKNLIYDNGDPFAYNARIAGVVTDEKLRVPTGGTGKVYLAGTNISTSTVEIYRQPNRQGTKLTSQQYTIGRELQSATTNPGKYYVNFTAAGAVPPLGDTDVYATYSVDEAKLITTPTVTKPRVQLNANIKNDVDAFGLLKYKFLDVIIGGEKFEAYDLTRFEAAMRVTGHYPTELHRLYSDSHLTLIGQKLNEPGLTVNIKKADGTDPTPSKVGNLLAAADNFAVFDLPNGLEVGTYTFYVQRGDGSTVETFTMEVKDPSSAITPPVVVTADISGLQVGVPSTQTVTLNNISFDPLKVQVDIFSITGSAVGTGTNITKLANPNDNQFTYDMLAIPIPGTYKFRITYDNFNITERYFTVGAAALAAADITIPSPTPIIPVYTGAGTTPMYLIYDGTNLGSDVTKITAAKLNDGVSDFALTPYAVENTRIIFQIPDTSVLSDGTNYVLSFSLNGKTITIANAATAQSRVAGNTYSGTVYSGQAINSLNKRELTVTENGVIGSSVVAATGINLDGTKLSARIEKEDDPLFSVANPTISVTSATAANITIPLNLQPGHYMIKFYDHDGSANPLIPLTSFPLDIVNPVFNSITPDSTPVGSTPALTVSGTNLGRDRTKYKLRFTNANGINADFNASAIDASSRIQFNTVSGLAKGTYTVSLLYNNAALPTTRLFTVSSEPASLKENLARSVANRYKVFDFSVELPIGTELDQIVEFRFYNNIADTKVSSFRFNYVNPNLPYIQKVHRKNGGSDTEGTLITNSGTTEVNEQPSTFYVYTDGKTKKINVYFGDYNPTRAPDQTITTFSDAYLGKHGRQFTVTLNGMANGNTKMTIVPSLSANVLDKRSGENTAARKVYDLLISSTPYVILNNLYNGMVVKSELEFACTATPAGTPCLTGRLVNIPLANYGDPDFGQSQVEFYLNDQLRTGAGLFTVDDVLTGKFHIVLPTLQEGKNKITFVLKMKKNGVFTKVSEATYEIFKFSTNAPEFVGVSPVEPLTGQVLYKKSSNIEDTYNTTQSTVQFAGQFANISEIKLTMRSRNDDNEPIVLFDRRYGTNLNNTDPVNGYPNWWASLNPTTGQFLTVNLPLAKSGDTIFEFSITNASNIVVTKVVTINREVLPYVIISPRLSQNTKGESQANINSNYAEIEIEAENADQILFGKQEAIMRELTINNRKTKRFYYEAKDLKVGKNAIRFTVKSGTETINGDMILFNTNTDVEGAQYKTILKNKITAFNKLIQLDFPKGTNLMRNDPKAINQYITADRSILFGIAYQEDGRVDKYKHPATYDGQSGNPNPSILPDARFLLSEPTGRFRPASQLFWTDAGTINNNETDLKSAYTGGGKLPYDSTEYYNRQLQDLVVPTKRGELTLKYNDNIRNDAWKYLTVYHFDRYEDSSGVVKWRWRNIGGVVNTSAKTITVPFERFGYYQVMYMDQSFDDVTSHSWARNNLDTLYSKGYMVPKQPPTLFVPNDAISRGEFATLLVKIFEIPLNYEGAGTFTDVMRVNPLNNGVYDYKYIETAARAGIIRGMSGGRFQPDSAIKRQDAAVMISKAANMKLGNSDAKMLATLQKQFTDAASIESYTRPAVEAVVKAKLMGGKENSMLQGQKKATFRFDPQEPITRAEAAATAIAVLQQQKKVPK